MNHAKIRESVTAFNDRCALLDISFSGRHDDDIDEEKSGQTASPNKHTLLLTKVTLPNIPIKTFFTNLKHLTSIILDDIRLSTVPEEVGLHFPNLENLSLNENCLTSLPKMIGNLKNLKTLSFRKNNITELPYTFKCLCRLEFLDASSNELSEVPGKEMPLLSEILLANNSIHEFIVEKNDFKSLKTLDLSQNSLECIHGPFLAIHNLTKLYLYDNNLNEFPAFLTRLEKITELDIGQNSIDILPEQFESYPVITKLHISYNNIKEFPIWFFQLSSIKNLSFCCNPLEQSCFNDFKMENFSNVESINAHYCEDCEIHNINIPYDILPSLPDEFGFLKNIIDLNLSGIKLKTVPNSIGSMQSLTGLYLNNNLITCLPETICHLTSLKYFHISSNKLKELPESFGSLTSLQTFMVNDNYLAHMPPSSAKLNNLRYLDLVQNDFKTIPESVLRLPSISYLKIESDLIDDKSQYNNLMSNVLHLIPRAKRKSQGYPQETADDYQSDSDDSDISDCLEYDYSIQNESKPAAVSDNEDWDTEICGNIPYDELSVNKCPISLNYIKDCDLFCPAETHTPIAKKHTSFYQSKNFGQFSDAD